MKNREVWLGVGKASRTVKHVSKFIRLSSQTVPSDDD